MKYRTITLVMAAALGWICGVLILHLRNIGHTETPVASAASRRPVPRLPLAEWVSRREPLYRVENLTDYRREMAALKAKTHHSTGRKQLAHDLIHDGLSDELIKRILLEVDSPVVPRSALIRMIEDFAEISPGEAMDFLDLVEIGGKISKYNLSTLRSAVNREWVKQNPADAVTYAKERTEEDSYAMFNLIQDWCWIDPEAALRTLATLPKMGHFDPSYAGHEVEDAFGKWFEKSPIDASAWVHTECPSAWYVRLREIVLERGDQAPWEKLKSLTELPDFPKDLIQNVWSGWLGSDPEAAVAKLNELDAKAVADSASESDREMITAARRADFVWSYEEKPKERLLQVVDGIQSDHTRDALIRRFAESRMRSDFKTASSVISELRTESARQNVLGSLINQWVNRDLERLTGFLNTMPEDTTRHTAVVALVRVLGPIEPEAAKAWAESLPEGSAFRNTAEALLTNARE